MQKKTTIRWPCNLIDATYREGSVKFHMAFLTNQTSKDVPRRVQSCSETKCVVKLLDSLHKRTSYIDMKGDSKVFVL